MIAAMDTLFQSTGTAWNIFYLIIAAAVVAFGLVIGGFMRGVDEDRDRDIDINQHPD